MIENEFDNDTKYKLFRSVREILHPTISKKNISDYKIMISDSNIPIRVFYPKKISEISKIIIFIHGNGKITSCHGDYSNICKDLSTSLDKLVIGVEYEEDNKSFTEIIKDISLLIKDIYDGLEKNDISLDDIIVIGDSTGCAIIENLASSDFSKKMNKLILCYPILSKDMTDSKKYQSVLKNIEFNPNIINNVEEYFSKTDLIVDNKKKSQVEKLIIVGSVDSMIDGIKDYYLNDNHAKIVEIPFASHGFLKRMDQELAEDFYKELNDFI